MLAHYSCICRYGFFFFLRHSHQNNEISSPYNSHPKKAQTGSFMTHQMDVVNRKRNLSLQSVRDLEAIWNLITPSALSQTRITGSKLGRVWFLPSVQVMLIITLFLSCCCGSSKMISVTISLVSPLKGP